MNQTIENKINELMEIVQNVIRANQLYNTLEFLEISEFNSCITFAESIFAKLQKLKSVNAETSINALQSIISEISTLIRLYGCHTLANLITVCIGNKYIIEEKYAARYKLLNSYISPMRYKVIDWNKETLTSTSNETIAKTSDNFECFSGTTNANSSNNFPYYIHGIKVAIHHVENHKTLIVYGVIEDVSLELIDDKDIADKLYDLRSNVHVNSVAYERFINCLTPKDILVYSQQHLKERYTTMMEDANMINKKPLIDVINEFIDASLHQKRNTLITLLVNSAENTCHYLAYLLYDLLSNDIRGMIDTYEQTTIYDSLPYNIKKYFRNAMKNIITYTNKLTKIDITKISLDQRICLMKTDDTVKEKAMLKLKEIKTKAEDTGSKAMLYLEGLLKIPFGIYKEEPVLRLIPDIISLFSALTTIIGNTDVFIQSGISLPFLNKPMYSSLEVYKYFPLLKNQYKRDLVLSFFGKCKATIAGLPKKKLLELHHLLDNKCTATGKQLPILRQQLIAAIHTNMPDLLLTKILSLTSAAEATSLNEFNNRLTLIEDKISSINTFMKGVNDTLDSSVYGHTKAKRNIERIIGQWLNGDLTGYCFGFEGPPGVGKTSLAKKGIANCLKDAAGVSRPFAFIAMGGSTNASTLDGHNYTYVGSTWGRIVDILMDTKIMTPIIFID